MKHGGALLFAFSSCLMAACTGAMPTGGGAGKEPGKTPPGGSDPTTTPGDPGSPGEPGGKPDPIAAQPTNGAPPAAKSCQGNAPGPRVLRRLTRDQLAATLKDLFRDPNVPKASPLDDPQALGFHSDAALLVVRDLGAQQLMDQAEQVARWAATTKIDALSTCKTNDAACRGQFIRTFGKRAFRAPLTDAQVRAYDGLFAAEASFEGGVEAVVAAMLQAPGFLYRSELGVAGTNGEHALTAHEVASELSYLLVGSMPDDQLMMAADGNQLSTPEQIRKQADRLMMDPRAEEAVFTFVKGWLGLAHLESIVKDDKVFPLTDELRHEMMSETRAFVADAWKTGASFTDLFTAKHSFLSRKLGMHYGIDAPGTEPTKTTLPAGKRDPGFLAHASVLTAHSSATGSSPVARGKLVRTRLLCEELPMPPANLDTMLEPPKPGQSTRERYLTHSENAACAGCHQLMDPIGFGFEAYDGVGRRRDQEDGKPVDTSGTWFGAKGGDLPFKGLGELSGLLAKSEAARSCLSRYWAYSAYGLATWTDDACTYRSIETEAAKSDFSLKGVVSALVSAPHFTRRVRDR